MSKLSIYQTSWLNLVFENRNKEYGAYQLRQETVKTSFSALFIGLLFVSTLAIIPLIVNRFTPVVPIPEMPDLPPGIIVHFNPIIQPQIPKPITFLENTTPTTTTDKQLVDPIIVASNQPIDNIATNTNNSTPTTNTTGTGTTIQPTTTTNTGVVTNTTTPITITGPATVDALDKKPEFPGGINKFYAFVGNNFEKPELESGQIMKIYVSFVIEKDGSMSDIKVLQDPGFGLGKEAIRVLKSLKTKWTPGIIDKQAVRTAYSLPISVQMD
jgi:periplasmic protein TonB